MANADDRPRPYRALLLRCWQEGTESDGGPAQWRFVVEEVLHARRRHGFGDLETLLDFLREELADGERDAPEW